MEMMVKNFEGAGAPPSGPRAASELLLSLVKAAVLILLALVFVFPFVWMFTTSFKSLPETILFPPPLFPRVWHFENYALAWKEGHFLIYFRNSIVVCAAVIAAQLLVVTPAAYAFACRRFAGSGLLFALIILGLMVPNQVTFLPIYLLFSKLKLIDTYAALVLPFAASSFGIFLFTQSFKQVPRELIEAARLDHAGELKLIMRIMLPMAKPAVVTFVLFSFIAHWNDYFWVLSMTTSELCRTLPIGVAMLKEAEGVKHWHTMMAGNMILILPILSIYLLVSKHIKAAFTYGGIK